MKIEFERNIKSIEEIDVDFPIYRKEEFDWGDIVVISKIMEDKEITVRIESKDDFINNCSIITKDTYYGGNKEYFLALGEYECTKEEFDQIFNKAKQYFNLITY